MSETEITAALVTAIGNGTYDSDPIDALEFPTTGELREQHAYVMPAPGFDIEEYGEGWEARATVWQILLLTEYNPATAMAFTRAVLDALAADPTLGGECTGTTPGPIEPPAPETFGDSDRARKLLRTTIDIRVDR